MCLYVCVCACARPRETLDERDAKNCVLTLLFVGSQAQACTAIGSVIGSKMKSGCIVLERVYVHQHVGSLRVPEAFSEPCWSSRKSK